MFRFGCRQYVYVACCRLYYLYVFLIYGEYSAYFHSALHPSFCKKNPQRIFRKLPLDNFPHSAKYPFTSYRQSASTPDTRLAAAGKMASALTMLWLIPLLITVQYIMYFLLVLWMTSCFHTIGHKQIYTSLFTKQVAKNNKEKIIKETSTVI